MTRDLLRMLGVFAVLAMVSAGGTAEAGQTDRDGCRKDLKHRSDAKVWSEHQAALQRGDLHAVFCDYAEDAKVLMPGTVLVGRSAISQGFMQFFSLLGGVVPTVTSTTSTGGIYLSTFTVTTPVVSIPDGSDTFIIEKGFIRFQTVHAALEFSVPPAPPSPPSP